MRSFVMTAVVALGALASSGCTFHRVEINDPSVAVSAKKIVPGKTRREDLKEILGTEPTSFISLPKGGTLYTYAYGESKTGGLNLLVFSTSKTVSGLDTAFVMIDKDDVVTKTWVGDHSGDIDWEWWAFGE